MPMYLSKMLLYLSKIQLFLHKLPLYLTQNITVFPPKYYCIFPQYYCIAKNTTVFALNTTVFALKYHCVYPQIQLYLPLCCIGSLFMGSYGLFLYIICSIWPISTKNRRKQFKYLLELFLKIL